MTIKGTTGGRPKGVPKGITKEPPIERPTPGVPAGEDLKALRFLKSLRRGEEVVVNVDGAEQVMLVSRELDYAASFIETPWRLANVHLLKNLGGPSISVTVAQQTEKGGSESLPYILRVQGRIFVKAVEVGPDVYQRLDELADKYDDTRAMATAIKNMLSKRAVLVEKP